ncbi:energy transducer TonB [Flavobacterium limnophilum]|uniref:energy transducer TonB n=1 Tax=Flavobacterium limnophilum TaxID=3003262 RepID=UPI0024821CF1|nr:energy transducer TonB [Flavobacterium limnophilum]
MKSILFFLLFLLIPKIVFSQVSVTNELILSPTDKLFYLDSTNQETKSKDFKFYRIIKDYKLDKESYAILEYYKSGVLKMEGTSKTKEANTKEGELTYYYENGNKKSISNYIKGRVNGKDFEWYENGNKKSEGEYIEDEKKRTTQHKINQFWDANGAQKIVDGNGFFENQGENESEKGAIKNGFKEGPWEGSSTKFGTSYKETYQDGKLISGTSTDKNGETYHYTEAEVRPNPKNGIMDFYKFIAKNYQIPNSLPKDASGKIYITFVVNKEGKIVEPKILRDLGYGTGQEAARIVTAYDGFTPGEQRGRKVRCTYSIPITIQARR